MKLTVGKISTSPTLEFAFSELRRYLNRMDSTLFLEGRSYAAYSEATAGVLWLGLTGTVPAGEEDAISIRFSRGAGIITGSNERAVLIAVYRFLYELGCRWLHPGPDGEIIPKRSLSPETEIHVEERASCRHRAICIEGAVAYAHIYNIIDWLPKVGMNGYFVQYRVPDNFFALWSKHTGNPTLPPEPLTKEDAAHILRQLEEELHLRSLHHHAVGHGWTIDPGLENPEFLAQVQGKRELWYNIPNNTNLCYSNPAVRKRLTDDITAYCLEHPGVDHIHFWLADDGNNHCECDACQKMTPSDFYVKMLNELDEKLTAANCPAKVVFLLYQDLLWEPEQERLQNPERFVLMFAPSGRTYSVSYGDMDRETVIPLEPYRRNDNRGPRSVEGYLARLGRWQAQFPGDGFVFDYHLMWDYVCDPGYHECARILHRDMASLDKIGLNGMVSCQVQRASFPTGLPMYAMAKALWDRESDFDRVEQEYFKAAFGEDGEAVMSYTRTLSRLFDPVYLRGEKPPAANSEARENLRAAQVCIRTFQTEYLEQRKDASPAWKYLYYHGELCLILADLLLARSYGDMETVSWHYARMEAYLRPLELEVHTVLDVWNYLRMIRRKFIENTTGIML